MNRYVVSRELLEQNIKQLKKQAKGVPVWAVIKLAQFYQTSTDYILGLTNDKRRRT